MKITSVSWLQSTIARGFVLFLVVVWAGPALTPRRASARLKWTGLTIEAPESHAQLSGYPVRVVVRLGDGARPKTFRARLNGKDVTKLFEVTADGLVASVGPQDGLVISAPDGRRFSRRQMRRRRTNRLKVMVLGQRRGTHSESVAFNVGVDTLAEVGPAGGILEVSDPASPIAGARLELGLDSVLKEEAFFINSTEMPKELPSTAGGAGPPVRFGPSGFVFNESVLVTLPYDDVNGDGLLDTTGVPEGSLYVLHFDSLIGEWRPAEVISADFEGNTVTVRTTNFSVFLAASPIVQLPIEFEECLNGRPLCPFFCLRELVSAVQNASPGDRCRQLDSLFDTIAIYGALVDPLSGDLLRDWLTGDGARACGKTDPSDECTTPVPVSGLDNRIDLRSFAEQRVVAETCEVIQSGNNGSVEDDCPMRFAPSCKGTAHPSIMINLVDVHTRGTWEFDGCESGTIRWDIETWVTDEVDFNPTDEQRLPGFDLCGVYTDIVIDDRWALELQRCGVGVDFDVESARPHRGFRIQESGAASCPFCADDDNDGVTNDQDECADTPSGEPVDANGCSESQRRDSDADGVADYRDRCADTPSGEAVDSSGCSESQRRDSDADGVPDYLDNCRNTPSGEAVDISGCSESQRNDDDNDGVPNGLDRCSETLSGEAVDEHGCSDSQRDGDEDGDGVRNGDDHCRGTPAGEIADQDGCAESQGGCQGPNMCAPDPTFVQLSARQQQGGFLQRIASWPVALARKIVGRRSTSSSRGLKAEIVFPPADALVRGDVPIFGFASGSNFSAYRIDYGVGSDPQEWTAIHSSSDPQSEEIDLGEVADSEDETIRGNLATWDTGLRTYVYLPSHPKDHPVNLQGVHTVRLQVFGPAGAIAEDRITVEVGTVVPNAWGGSVQSPDGIVELDVPEQALMDSFRLISIKPSGGSLTDILLQGRKPIGKIYEMREGGERFTKSAMLKMTLPVWLEQAADASLVGIYGFDPKRQQWDYLQSELRGRIISAEIRKLAPKYVLMESSVLSEGSLVRAGLDESRVVIAPATRGAAGHYLVRDTFEESVGEWSSRDEPVGAEVSMESARNSDGNRYLTIRNVHGRGNMAVTVVGTPYDVRRFPIVRFDYRVPSDVKSNLLVKAGGRWFSVGFTDDRQDLVGRRVNIAHIGDIENVVADDQWHSARFDLYELLRTKTGSRLVEEIVMADWDVPGYMKLQFGNNRKGATYNIDNFSISRNVLAGALIDDDQLAVSNFDRGNNATALGGIAEVFKGGDTAEVELGFEKGADGFGKSLVVSYSTPSPDDFVGYVMPLGTVDLRDHQAIAFEFDSAQAAVDLHVGLADHSGTERKVVAAPYIQTLRDGGGWQTVRIPLAAFGADLDLARIERLIFAFDDTGGDRRIARLDDVVIERSASRLMVDDMERPSGINLVGGAQSTYAHGAAAIKVAQTHNSPNGVYAISYGGSISQASGMVSGLDYALWKTELNGVDCSGCSEISFRMKGLQGGERPNVYLSDGNFRWGVDVEAYAAVTTEWQDYSIPLSDFAEYGVDRTHLTEFEVVFEWEPMSGTVYIDDLLFGGSPGVE